MSTRKGKRQMPKGYVQSAILQLNQAIQILHSRLADVEIIVEHYYETHEDEVLAFLDKKKTEVEAQAKLKAQEQTVDDSSTHRERKSEGTGTPVSKE
ncbi:MAG: hypothetical protein HN932_12895 [Candidatus Marinimicrobia bacterium]|jgi:hypothetical protein|nr:hypothetical protein [Candidatus Neomarinimicrobiota bacterium]MBT7339112.1 hypothetical protein [Candidatus Jacksonbacteria bacterium]